MNSELLEYAAVLKTNRETFLLNYKEEFVAFEKFTKSLNKIAEFLSKNTTPEGSHVGLIPFILILERQAKIAFDNLMNHQSFNSWNSFRPGLESFLIIGKFIDDPKSAELWKKRKEIWEKRKEDKDKYNELRRHFEGAGLISKSLLFSKEVRTLLTIVNDDFMHMNPSYLYSSASREELGDGDIFVKVTYTDTDGQLHQAYLYSFLHLFITMTYSLGEILSTKFGKHPELIIKLNEYENVWASKVQDLIKNRPDLVAVLKTFGLWNV